MHNIQNNKWIELATLIMIYDSFLPENTVVLQQSQKAITIYLYF